VPTAGSSDRKAISTAQRSGACTPSTLQDGDDHVAFHRGAHDDGELGEERALPVGAQRHRGAQARVKPFAIAQQEEKQVKHHRQADQEFERVLADAERLLGEELARLRGARRELALQRVDIVQPQSVERAARPRRQRLDHLAEIPAEAHLARTNALIDARRFVDQRDGEQDERHDDHRHHDRERRRGCERAAIAQRPLQAPEERREEDRENRSPQDGAEERPDDERERRRYEEQQPGESAFLDRLGAIIAALRHRRGSCLSFGTVQNVARPC
jgi:hypothetical protein